MLVFLLLASTAFVGVTAGQTARVDGSAPPTGAGSMCQSGGEAAAGAVGDWQTQPIDRLVPNESRDLTVAHGDVAVVPLSVPSGQNVTVTVGDGDGYSSRTAVRDDGDGNVTLLVNTYNAGSLWTDASDTYRAVGDDIVTVLGGRTNVTLERRSYPVTARKDGAVVDETTLTVADRSIGNVSAYRALPRVLGAANASEMRAAQRNGSLEPLRPGDPPQVVEGETLVLAMDAPNLLGVVASRPGDTTTDRVLALHHRQSTIPTQLEILGPCGGISLRRAAENGKFRAISDYRDGTLSLLLDTDDLLWNAGDQWFHLEIGPQSRLVDDGTELERGLSFQTNSTRPQMVRTGDSTIRLPPSEAVTVRGESRILPGSRISVLLQYASTNDDTTIARTNTTVSENGTFTATFDLSQASEERRYSVFSNGRQPSIETWTPTEDETPTATETDSDAVTATTVQSSPPTDSVPSSTRPERTTTGATTMTETITETTAGASSTALTATRTTTADGPGFGATLALAVVAAGAVLLVRQR